MYAVLNMGWKPNEFIDLPRSEKIFVMAAISIKVEAEEREQMRLKNLANRK